MQWDLNLDKDILLKQGYTPYKLPSSLISVINEIFDIIPTLYMVDRGQKIRTKIIGYTDKNNDFKNRHQHLKNHNFVIYEICELDQTHLNFRQVAVENLEVVENSYCVSVDYSDYDLKSLRIYNEFYQNFLANLYVSLSTSVPTKTNFYFVKYPEWPKIWQFRYQIPIFKMGLHTDESLLTHIVSNDKGLIIHHKAKMHNVCNSLNSAVILAGSQQNEIPHCLHRVENYNRKMTRYSLINFLTK